MPAARAPSISLLKIGLARREVLTDFRGSSSVAERLSPAVTCGGGGLLQRLCDELAKVCPESGVSGEVALDGVTLARAQDRFPPTCNPYLAFAACVMAGLDGVQNKIDPGPRTSEAVEDSIQAIIDRRDARLSGT